MASLRTAFFALAFAAAVTGGSLADVKHVVMIMFENRSFDHYFGTMSGVRGFSDPNVQVNPSTGYNTFQQLTTTAQTTEAKFLLPYYTAYQGGTWVNASQCTYGGSNAWTQNHAAINGGLNDHWVMNNTANSMGYYQREIIPVHFSVAESFTVADMYQQSVIAATNPNRVSWMSGSVNVPGGKQTPDQGGTLLQNSCTITCDSVDPPIDCCPLRWKTVAEYAQDAGVGWRLYQDDFDVAGQDLFNLFENFIEAGPGNPLYYRGSTYFANNTLDAFYADALNGTLPAVSWLIPEQALSEHPPWMPVNGGWLQKQIVEAVINGKSWNDTVLLISYDEEGGWYDHVSPFVSPAGTAGEWMEDPYGDFGQVPAGPGARLPFTIISPWTRGGRVFTEHASHESQILFLEQFLQANGYDFVDEQISDWRRAHMSNLVNAFDFDNPDFSIPSIPDIMTPNKDSSGNYDDVSICQAEYPNLPTPPYGTQIAVTEMHTLSEQGFKPMRGALTEGRYLTIEANGFALSNPSTSTNQLSTTAALADHSDIHQRWIVHQLDVALNVPQFNISSAVDGKFLSQHTSLSTAVSGAEVYTVTFLGNGQGYTLQKENGSYLTVDGNGNLVISSTPQGFQFYSVTYNT